MTLIVFVHNSTRIHWDRQIPGLAWTNGSKKTHVLVGSYFIKSRHEGKWCTCKTGGDGAAAGIDDSAACYLHLLNQSQTGGSDALGTFAGCRHLNVFFIFGFFIKFCRAGCYL